jgi:hypothetical protein
MGVGDVCRAPHMTNYIVNHPTIPNTLLVGLAFEWLTMTPTSEHGEEWRWREGMNFDFRGITSQSNGGGFGHRNGTTSWWWKSERYCSIQGIPFGLADTIGNAAAICSYYLPNSTPTFPGPLASAVNGQSRGVFAPGSMGMSNWGVNMSGTARIRYIYWTQDYYSQPATPTPTPPPTSTMPTVTLDDFGIFLEDTWSPEERAEILRAAWETGRALSAHGAAATPVEAFREVLQGRNANGVQRRLRFRRIGNIFVCITDKLPDNPDISASVGCNSNVIMNQYTAVHEFGHVLVSRTGSFYIDRVEGPAECKYLCTLIRNHQSLLWDQEAIC